MLQLENIHITQGDFSLTANFTVPHGAQVAVIGPSGAGKSTLLGAIAGFVPAQGRITWNGAALVPDPGARPVSILFQDNNLFPHLSVFDNVALGLKPSLRLTTAEQAQVRQALDRVDLSGMDTRRPADLSGGQQSRVALARTLIRARPLLLLDEPFAALGPALKADMLALVQGIAQDTGATLLMVSHDVADARAICDQTVLVANGTAHPPQATATILDNPPPELRAYLG
jgi:thiamine transport system ATP-binding protein